MHKTLFIFTIIFSLACPALAHEIKYRDKIILQDTLIKERSKYEKCLEKAKKNADVPLAEETCRKKYAKTRLFTVEELFHMYAEHTIIAEDVYTELLIALQGKVFRIGKSGLGYPEITFAVDAFGLTGIKCEFPKRAEEFILQLKIGDEVIIEGISKGLMNDKYIRITHCDFIEK